MRFSLLKKAIPFLILGQTFRGCFNHSKYGLLLPRRKNRIGGSSLNHRLIIFLLRFHLTISFDAIRNKIIKNFYRGRFISRRTLP